MAGEDTSGRWRSHWPKRLRYGQTADQARGSKATGAGGRQPARQRGAVVSSPAPRSTPEARAIERAFAREITERLSREGVARLCRAERASGSERVCCSMMCGVLVLILKRCNRTRTIRLHLVFAIHRGYNLTIVVQSPEQLLEMFCFDTFPSML